MNQLAFAGGVSGSRTRPRATPSDQWAERKPGTVWRLGRRYPAAPENPWQQARRVEREAEQFEEWGNREFSIELQSPARLLHQADVEHYLDAKNRALDKLLDFDLVASESSAFPIEADISSEDMARLSQLYLAARSSVAAAERPGEAKVRYDQQFSGEVARAMRDGLLRRNRNADLSRAILYWSRSRHETRPSYDLFIRFATSPPVLRQTIESDKQYKLYTKAFTLIGLHDSPTLGTTPMTELVGLELAITKIRAAMSRTSPGDRRPLLAVRLFRRVPGEQPPLILHRRLSWVRSTHVTIRFAILSLMRKELSLPFYERPPKRTPEEQQQLLDACENFIGGRSKEPQLANFYRERSRRAILERNSPAVSEEYKEFLRKNGPLCTDEEWKQGLAARADKASS